MSRGVPTDEQLARMEAGVLRRIDRRAAIRRTAVTGSLWLSVLVVVVLSGGVLLRSTGAQTTSSGAAGGSSARSAASVQCHRGSTAGSAAVPAPLAGASTADHAVRACATLTDGSSAAPGERSAAPGAQVVCRDRRKELHVFVPDAHPATQCGRNGMSAAR